MQRNRARVHSCQKYLFKFQLEFSSNMQQLVVVRQLLDSYYNTRRAQHTFINQHVDHTSRDAEPFNAQGEGERALQGERSLHQLPPTSAMPHNPPVFSGRCCPPPCPPPLTNKQSRSPPQVHADHRWRVCARGLPSQMDPMRTHCRVAAAEPLCYTYK